MPVLSHARFFRADCTHLLEAGVPLFRHFGKKQFLNIGAAVGALRLTWLVNCLAVRTLNPQHFVEVPIYYFDFSFLNLLFALYLRRGMGEPKRRNRDSRKH